MDLLILPDAFNLLMRLGVWAPRHLTSGFSKTLYSLYSFLAFSQVIWITLTQVIAAAFFTETFDEFLEMSCVMFSLINTSVKSLTILLKRGQVIKLSDMLLEEECIPGNADEKKICFYFDKICRYLVICVAVLAISVGIILSAWPLIFYAGESLPLPLKTLHLFEFDSGVFFWLAYVHQTVTLTMAATIEGTTDCLFIGFMLQACAQMELMIFRLQKLPAKTLAAAARTGSENSRDLEKRVIKQTVRHHILIFRFTDSINNVFAPLIAIQFCLSSILLCVTVYQVSVNKSRGVEVLSALLYFLGLLIEFFIYCWFGNEVTVKSTSLLASICEMDWTVLNVKTRYDLLMMMVRSTSPIVMSCGPLAELTLESFATMLKISYSAVNVLQ